MVSRGPFGNLRDPVNTVRDMSYLKSNPCTTNPQGNTFSGPRAEELKTALFPTSLLPNHARKLQDSRSLAPQSLSTESNEIPSVIPKTNTLPPTPTVGVVVKPATIELTPNLDSAGFLSGVSIDSIPKPDAGDENKSSMNLPKQGSEEDERDGTLEKKELLMPMEERSEDFNVVNAETDGYQATPESYSGDSDNTSGSSIYQELCDVSGEDTEGHQEVVASALDPMRQALVDRLMDEFWMIFGQSWDTGHRECAGASASSSSVANGISNFTSESSSALGPRKRPREDDELPNDNSGRNSRGPGDSVRPSSRPEEGTRFACPFRKHSTRLYSIYSHPICALSHWETIARVKYVDPPFQAEIFLTGCREHLYRGHRMAAHCKRCWKVFNNQEQLDSHLTVATPDICDLQPGHPPEGITPEHERCLRSRKKTSPNQTEADRWKDIYKLLFPDEEIPSPCKLVQLENSFLCPPISEERKRKKPFPPLH